MILAIERNQQKVEANTRQINKMQGEENFVLMAE